MRRLLRCLVLVTCLPRSLLPPPRCVSAFEQYKYFSLHRERGAEHFRVASSEYFDDDTVRRLLAILPLPTFHSILSQRHEAIGILRQSKSFPTRRCRMIKSDDILAAELVDAVEGTHGSGLRAMLMAIVDNLLSTTETLETITPDEVEDAAQELFLLLYGALGKDATHAFGEVLAFACRHRREPTSWHRRMLRRESDQWRPSASSSSSVPAAHPTRPESFTASFPISRVSPGGPKSSSHLPITVGEHPRGIVDAPRVTLKFIALQQREHIYMSGNPNGDDQATAGHVFGRLHHTGRGRAGHATASP